MDYSGGIFYSIVTAHFLLELLFNCPPGSTMSLPNTNFPGVAFSVVRNLFRIAYAAEAKNGPEGFFSSIYLPSISAVLNESLSVK
jgi:hypothetical protein